MTNPESEEDEPFSRPPLGAMVFFLLALAALVAVFVVADFGPRTAPASSEVRIRNNTKYMFRQVVVNGKPYGNINAGESTEYRNLGVAYRYASVKLIAGTREMHLMPEDYVGEVPLGSGKFTYVLSIVDTDRIDLSVEKESR